MSVETNIGKARYEGNGSAVRFPVPFAYEQPEHIRCVVQEPDKRFPEVPRQKELKLGDEFSLEGSGEDGEGVLVYPLDGAPMAEGFFLTIVQHIPITQERRWSNADAVDLREIEKADDKLTRICQQLEEKVERCVRVGVASDMTPADHVETMKTFLTKAEGVSQQLKDAEKTVNDARFTAEVVRENVNIAERYAYDSRLKCLKSAKDVAATATELEGKLTGVVESVQKAEAAQKMAAKASERAKTSWEAVESAREDVAIIAGEVASDSRSARRSADEAALAGESAQIAVAQAAATVEEAEHLLEKVKGGGGASLYEMTSRLVCGPKAGKAEKVWCVTGIDSVGYKTTTTMPDDKSRVRVIFDKPPFGWKPGEKRGRIDVIPDDFYIVMSWGDRHALATYVESDAQSGETMMVLHPMHEKISYSEAPRRGYCVTLTLCERLSVKDIGVENVVEREFYTHDPLRLCSIPERKRDVTGEATWVASGTGVTCSGGEICFAATDVVHAVTRGLQSDRSYLVEIDVALSQGAIRVCGGLASSGVYVGPLVGSSTHGTCSFVVPAYGHDGSVVIQAGPQGAQGKVSVKGLWEVESRELCVDPLFHGIGQFGMDEGWTIENGQAKFSRTGTAEDSDIWPIIPASRKPVEGRVYCMQVQVGGVPHRCMSLCHGEVSSDIHCDANDLLNMGVICASGDVPFSFRVGGSGSAVLDEFHLYRVPSPEDPIIGRFNPGGFIGSAFQANRLRLADDASDGNAVVRLCGRLEHGADEVSFEFVGKGGQCCKGSRDGALAAWVHESGTSVSFNVCDAYKRLEYVSAEHFQQEGVFICNAPLGYPLLQFADAVEFPVVEPGSLAVGVPDSLVTGNFMAELFGIAPEAGSEAMAYSHVLECGHATVSVGEAQAASGPSVRFSPIGMRPAEYGIVLWPYFSVRDGERWLVCLCKEVRSATSGGDDIASHEDGTVVVPSSGALAGQCIWAGTSAGGATNATLLPLPDGGVGKISGGNIVRLTGHKIVGGLVLDDGEMPVVQGKGWRWHDDGFGNVVRYGAVAAPMSLLE